MRAIHIAEALRLEAIEVAAPPSPGPGEALVRTHRVGVCGTDVSSYLGKFPFFDYPRIPGHELGVEVLEVGEDVAGVQPGDRCSVEPYMHCGTCYPCRSGKQNCCTTLNVIGVMSDGGLCERFLIRADKLHPSSALDYEQLALVETLAIGCHAIGRASPSTDEHLLIIGAGPIGLSALEFARLTGAKITVMDRVKGRLNFCQERYGIDHTILADEGGNELAQAQDITSGDLFATVIDATGNAGSMAAALGFVAHGGSLVYLGVTTENISFPHPQLHRREMTIMGSRNALPTDFRRCIELIEAGQIDTAPWITHRTSFDKVITDFDSFTKPDSGVLKAVIELT